ncbi:unnamed protein product [Toxocara canis]|uniref:Peptidylprolyl isomerase n=1 Tax=Toxocara canis TaxID=6265 RepID=A0A183UFU0_TOXCA|nr:unnamed protein product [Toxocara canis]
MAINTSDEENVEMNFIHFDAPRAAFLSAFVGVVAVTIVVVVFKALSLLRPHICKAHHGRTAQHEANMSQRGTDHNEPSTKDIVMSKCSHEKKVVQMVETLDDGKHVPFKFDSAEYRNTGGMECGYIPKVALYYVDVIGGSEAYNASTLVSSVFSSGTDSGEYSDSNSTNASVDTLELDMFGFEKINVEQSDL